MPTISERRTLGSTSVSVTRLGLGCAPLGNLYREVDDADARATVEGAWDAGVRFYDTAPLYGHGLSEVRLGAALTARASDRADAVVATKVGRVLKTGPPGDTIFAGVPPGRPLLRGGAAGAAGLRFLGRGCSAIARRQPGEVGARSRRRPPRARS